MSNRQQLRFEEETLAAFSFLVQEFHFTNKLVSLHRFRYESDKVYIQIEHGDYDFCISLFFGRLKQMSEQIEMYDFSLFLKLINPTLEEGFGDMVAGTQSKVHEMIQKLAIALRSDGLGIIMGDDKIFEQMKSVTWWQFQPDALSENKEVK